MFQPVTAQLHRAAADVSFDWSGPQIFFVIIAVLTIAGALLTVTRRNAIAAVMSLVATFFGLAALYAMLSAHFLAVLQVLVYAGAIMTLFVFVVMVLNRDESEPWSLSSGLGSKLIGVASLMYMVYWIGNRMRQISPARDVTPPADFGTVEQVGNILFTDYLFVFEAVSVLLLIAVIAAVVVARSKQSPEAEAEAAAKSESNDHSHAGDHA